MTLLVCFNVGTEPNCSYTILGTYLDTIRKRTSLRTYKHPDNYFPACGDFCQLLIIFSNSMDPDQPQHYVRPELDSN